MKEPLPAAPAPGHTALRHGDATERMRAVALAGALLVSARTLHDFARVLAEACERVMPFDMFETATYDERAHALTFSGGLDAGEYLPAMTVRVAGTPSEAVIREQRSLVTHRSTDPAALGAVLVGTGRRSESIIRTPILADGRVIGLILVQSYTPDLYTPLDVEVMETIAALAATALLNIEHLAERDLLVAELRDERERLREGDARLRMAVVAAQMAVWECDLRTGVLVDVAPRPEGAPMRRVVPPTYAAFLELVHPDDRARVGELRAQAVAAHSELDVEYRIVRPDGSTIWQQTLGKVVVNANGRATRAVGVTLDVTERKLLEERLRHAQRLEAVGQLAGGVAHDFNNLLTAVSISLESVRDTLGAELPPEHPALGVAMDLDEAARAAARATSLTRQLLAFSRKQVLRPETLDVNAVVREAERMLRRLLPGNIVGDDALAATWPVHADQGQLEQVLTNLVVNARDAMPDGGVITIETADAVLAAGDVPDLAAGEYVRISVADTGTGMDAVTLSHAFEPFFTTKPLGRGTGLGLATVHGIVAQSGGSVRATSAVGQGSTFDVHLPRAPAARAPMATAGMGADTPLRGSECVLLVEDERSVRDAARRMLERRGYCVLEARHGADALLLWQQRREEVALVLTDVRMPEMDGPTLAAALRREAPALPIVFMSGYLGDPRLAGESGAGIPAGAPFVEKPFRSETLLAAVRAALGVARGT